MNTGANGETRKEHRAMSAAEKVRRPESGASEDFTG